MAGYAGGVHGGAARRIDAPGDSQQGRSVEFRAVHVFEYSARRGALGKTRHYILGTAAADGLRRLGAGPRGIAPGPQTANFFRHPTPPGFLALPSPAIPPHFPSPRT